MCSISSCLKCFNEQFARCIFGDIQAAYADEEIQKEFAAWQAERAASRANLKLHTKKAGAAGKAAPAFLTYVVSYLVDLSAWIRVVSSSYWQNRCTYTS